MEGTLNSWNHELAGYGVFLHHQEESMKSPECRPVCLREYSYIFRLDRAPRREVHGLHAEEEAEKGRKETGQHTLLNQRGTQVTPNVLSPYASFSRNPELFPNPKHYQDSSLFKFRVPSC